MTQGQQDYVLDTLRNIFHLNTGKSKEKYLVSEILWEDNADLDNTKKESLLKTMWRQTVPLFKSPFLCKTTLVSLAHFVVFLRFLKTH